MPLTSVVVVAALALSPFSVGDAAFARHAIGPVTSVPPASEPTEDNGWDDGDAPPAEDGGGWGAEDSSPQPEVGPEPAPATTPMAPAGTVVDKDAVAKKNLKPQYKKGTGLIVAASVTSGIGWIAAFARMAFVKQCIDAVEGTDDVESGFSAARTCFVKAGAGNLALLPVQYLANVAAWGLAPGGGVVRGRWEGVERAWSNQPSRKSNAFIGAGAALLAVGIIGRITAAVMVGRPYRHLNPAFGDIDTTAFSSTQRARMFGVQLSSATIALGGGLLGFGLAHKKHYGQQSAVFKNVRLAPDMALDPKGGGIAFGGIMLSGQF